MSYVHVFETVNLEKLKDCITLSEPGDELVLLGDAIQMKQLPDTSALLATLSQQVHELVANDYSLLVDLANSHQWINWG